MMKKGVTACMSRKTLMAMISAVVVLVVLGFTFLTNAADSDTEEVLRFNTDNMKIANIWPNLEECPNETPEVPGWNRTLTDTEDGLRIQHSKVDNNLNHCTRTMVTMNGAHMKLTFHVPADENDTENTCDISKTVGLTFGKTGSGSFNNNPKQGLHFKIQVATGQLYCYVDGTSIDHSGYEGYNAAAATDRIFIPEEDFDRSATTLDVRTSITDKGEFVLDLNGYEFTIAKDVWQASTYAGEQMFVKIGTEGKLLDCTVHTIHGGNEICTDEAVEIMGEENMNQVLAAVTAINNIALPISEESGEQIEAAKAAVEAVDEEYRVYISNLATYESAVEIFATLDPTAKNLDPDIYPVELADVGAQRWKPEFVSFYRAESGKGVTIEYNNTTVHQLGININKAAALDNLHIHFDNFEATGGGNMFALVFSYATQADVTQNFKCMWLTFATADDSVKVELNAVGMESYVLVDTTAIGKEDLADLWSIAFKKLENGDYQFTLCDTITGTIPKAYIEAAEGAGMNVTGLYVSYSSYNLGNVADSHSKMDIVSIHSGADECYSQVSEADYIASEECKALIDAIGTVTENSSAAIEAANNAYNALSPKIQNLITNAADLVRATKDYNNIAYDVKVAAAVIESIDKLPANPEEATYEQLIDSYGKYLDLYPRSRKRVTNADKLLACVAAYEAAHPGVELKQETVNEYTGGKNAHYITGNK